MKRLVSICLLFVCLCSFGQFSNDWIDYGQKYYRIPITSKGVYKITYADLVANGISVGDFDHRNLQIIHNGARLFVGNADQKMNDLLPFVNFTCIKVDEMI